MERGWYGKTCSRWNACPLRLSFLTRPRAHREKFTPKPSRSPMDKRPALRQFRRRYSG